MGDSIAINFVIRSSYLTYDSYRIVIEKDIFDADGNVIDTEEYVYTAFERYSSTSTTYMKVKFDKIAAREMGTAIRATIYGTKNGVVYSGGPDTYAVADYCVTQLNNASAKTGLKTLCADLLNYGAAAQTYKAYNTANLVNAIMTEEQAAYASDKSALSLASISNRVNNTGATLTWAGNALDLRDQVELQYVFNVPSGTDRSKITVSVTYTDAVLGAQTKTFSGSEIQEYSATRCKITVDTLKSYDMSVPVTAVLYYDGVEQGTAVYSIESYAAGRYTANTALGNCMAFLYGNAALAYFD